jgi:hypothetical protein
MLELGTDHGLSPVLPPNARARACTTWPVVRPVKVPCHKHYKQSRKFPLRELSTAQIDRFRPKLAQDRQLGQMVVFSPGFRRDFYGQNWPRQEAVSVQLLPVSE